MPNSIASVPNEIPAHRKSTARVALIDLPDASAQLVTECFRHSGIETVLIPRAHADRLQREKFEACVLPLGEAARDIIELTRASASNGRIIIYGLGGTVQDAMRYSKLCLLNAVFHEPLERSADMAINTGVGDEPSIRMDATMAVASDQDGQRLMKCAAKRVIDEMDGCRLK